MSGFWDNGPKSRHRYTVASAPVVIGSVFKRIFQLYLGQCTYCKFKKLGMCTSDGSALRLSLTAPCIDFIRVNVACPSVDYSSTLYTVKKNSEIRTNKFKTDFSKCAILQHSGLNGFWLLAIYTWIFKKLLLRMYSSAWLPEWALYKPYGECGLPKWGAGERIMVEWGENYIPIRVSGRKTALLR